MFQNDKTLCKNKIKVELDLSNYASKYDKMLQVSKHRNFAREADLASLKSVTDDLDTDLLNLFLWIYVS